MSEQEPTDTDPDHDTEQFAGADPPRIYVASLSDYNAGNLHGAWIDATDDTDQMATAIQAMLDDSPEPIAEEWAIHDYEGWGPLRLSEHESLDNIAGIAAGIAEHGLAFAGWVAQRGEIPDDEHFEDHYLGEYDSIEHYARELVTDLGVRVTVEPASWAHYVHFDTDALARDLATELSTEANGRGGVYLFGS